MRKCFIFGFTLLSYVLSSAGLLNRPNTTIAVLHMVSPPLTAAANVNQIYSGLAIFSLQRHTSEDIAYGKNLF